METINKIENQVENNLKKVLENPYVMAVLKITLIVFATQITPRSPQYLKDVFSNTFVKIISLALIGYLVQIDFQLAILLAIIFVLGMNIASGRGLLESFQSEPAMFYKDQTKYTNLLGRPAKIGNALLLDSQSDNYSGCENILLADLLAIFDNDYNKIQETVQYTYKDLMRQLPDTDSKTKLEKMARAAGLPYNVEINDYNAPLIATILLNYGFVISESCQAPNGDEMHHRSPLPAYLELAQKIQAAAGDAPRKVI